MKIGNFDTKFKYIPYFRNVPDVPSAWHPNERVLTKILRTFDIPRNTAVDFGVDWGFSTAVLANHFDSVTGVDDYQEYSATRPKGMYEKVKEKLAKWDNITLVKSDYQTFIAKVGDTQFDLAHIDIIHDYEHTFECGLWAANHSKITLFHDTLHYSEVFNAVVDIAAATGKTYYNFQEGFGLGILVATNRPHL